VTFVVGGPVTFERVMVAVPPVAWTARRVRLSRVRLSARTTSRESPMGIVREKRARIERPHFVSKGVLHLGAEKEAGKPLFFSITAQMYRQGLTHYLDKG